jgi:hypothetical protein
MKTLLLLTLLAVSKPAAPPELKTPLVLTLTQSVGFAPLTLRVKARAEAEGKEVCVVVDGPEYQKACRTLAGVTWTQDFVLRVSGCYAVFAVSEQYRTPEVTVRVIGQSEQECS